MRAADHSFTKTMGQSWAAVFLHGGYGPLGDIGGETGVGEHGGGLAVSHLRASLLGPSSGKVAELVGAFKLRRRKLGVAVDVIGSGGVDPPEHIGGIALAVLERGREDVSEVWLVVFKRPQSKDVLGQM